MIINVNGWAGIMIFTFFILGIVALFYWALEAVDAIKQITKKDKAPQVSDYIEDKYGIGNITMRDLQLYADYASYLKIACPNSGAKYEEILEIIRAEQQRRFHNIFLRHQIK